MSTSERRLRRGWCLAALASGGLLVASCTGGGKASEPAPRRPNVILISIDTLRADRLNVHGYQRHPTSPTIDALARDGIVHDAHIASSPWTIPSHLSLLTSLHPSAHGVVQGVHRWVLTSDREARYVRIPSTRVTLAESLAAADYRTAAFTGGVTLDPRIGFDQGFDLFDTSMYKLGPQQVQPMLDWMGAESDRPFFLFWHTFEVHAPYTRGRFLPPSHAGLRTDLERLTQIMVDDPEGALHGSAQEVTEQLLDRHNSRSAAICSDLYDGGVAATDFWIGRLLEFLLDQELYDSTMIVLTSDHGEELGDHDPEAYYDKHGHSAYEELLRIPLVVKLPGSVHAGLRVDAVTSGVDVMPTVLDVVGVAGPGEQMQGRSLAGSWDGRGAPARPAFSEATAYADEIKSVRGPRYKLVFEIGPDTVARHGRSFVPQVPERRRLFDLSTDPRERSDLLANTPRGSAGEIAAGLEKELRAFAAGTPGEVEEIALDAEAVERLKAMGYIQ